MCNIYILCVTIQPAWDTRNGEEFSAGAPIF